MRRTFAVAFMGLLSAVLLGLYGSEQAECVCVHEMRANAVGWALLVLTGMYLAEADQQIFELVSKFKDAGLRLRLAVDIAFVRPPY